MNSRLKLKQVVTATAATTAMMLGMADANAITLGEPGGALLVPYVTCDSTLLNGAPAMNTQVAIVTAGMETLEAFDPSTRQLVDGILTPPPNGVPPFRGPLGAASANYGGALQITFFDKTSKHKLDYQLPVTYNDVVLLDWCAAPGVKGNPNTDEAAGAYPGYLLIYDAENYKPTGGVPNTGSQYGLWGSAFLIKNGWDSMAFIPVISLADSAGMDAAGNLWIDPLGDKTGQSNEIIYDRNGRPIQVVPWLAGIRMNNQNGIKDNYILSIRYFLDNTLAAKNQFVFWFSENCTGLASESPYGCNRRIVHADVFDTDENFKNSDQTSLPYELNILEYIAADPVKELVDGKCVPIQPQPGFPEGWLAGMLNGAIEHRPNADGGEYFCTNNSGLVFFKISEAVGGFEGNSNAAPGGQADNNMYFTAGVAFNLMFLHAGRGGATPIEQVQTELAQERGFDF